MTGHSFSLFCTYSYELRQLGFTRQQTAKLLSSVMHKPEDGESRLLCTSVAIYQTSRHHILTDYIINKVMCYETAALFKTEKC